MRIAFYVVVVFITTAASTSAQRGVTGTWRADGVGTGPWTVTLRADGDRFTGRVSSCTSLPVDIIEAAIDGPALTFKCKSVDGDRILTLKGRVTGDEIAFTWDKQIRHGGALRPAEVDLDVGDANAFEMFGPSTPPQFIAQRVPASGTEFAAALNLPATEVKVEGTLFLPPNIGHVRAVIVLLNSGTSWNGMGGAYYLDPELRRLATTLNCALLLPRITSTNLRERAKRRRRSAISTC